MADLEEFLAPRWQAGPDLRWTRPYQWHVTLAFLPEVAERHLDDLEQRLTRAATRRHQVRLRLGGAGAFPNPAAARVLWAGVGSESIDDDDAMTELDRLAVGARAAASKAGVAVAGDRFTPHVTLARLGRPANVTRWLSILATYQGPGWPMATLSLIRSYLGEGPGRRPRYEQVGAYPVGVGGRRSGPRASAPPPH